MKKIHAFHFSELSPKKQDEILNNEISSLIDNIIEKGKKVLPNNLEKNFERAFAKCERAKTPWFFGSILMEDSAIESHVKDCAQENVENCLYIDGFIDDNGTTRAIVIL